MTTLVLIFASDKPKTKRKHFISSKALSNNWKQLFSVLVILLKNIIWYSKVIKAKTVYS